VNFLFGILDISKCIKKIKIKEVYAPKSQDITPEGNTPFSEFN
jgi:hypothetical protein